ncbi:hypothetical protein MNV49_000514 [Pseudohyphozyma bogoriensis]|nr:hypothetical protein MNV49_000514 [Pseudohyphozyma bogoriensis]
MLASSSLVALLLPALALTSAIPGDVIPHGLHLLKRQAETTSIGGSGVLGPAATSAFNGTIPTSRSVTSGSASGSSAATRTTASATGTATRTSASSSTPSIIGCNARRTGVAFTDSANDLTCQLNTMSTSFTDHLSCVPRGGGLDAVCADLVNLNQPCVYESSDAAAAKCICTAAYYAAWVKCAECVESPSHVAFASACAGLGYSVDSSVPASTSPALSGDSITSSPTGTATGSNAAGTTSTPSSAEKIVGGKMVVALFSCAVVALGAML